MEGKVEEMKTSIIIDGQNVFFERNDGSLAENSVGVGGTDADGNLIFFEIVGTARPKLGAETKYRRLLIRRVFPCLPYSTEECAERCKCAKD